MVNVLLLTIVGCVLGSGVSESLSPTASTFQVQNGVDLRRTGLLQRPERQNLLDCWAFAAAHLFMDSASVALGQLVPPIASTFVSGCCRPNYDFTGTENHLWLRQTCRGVQQTGDFLAGLFFLFTQHQVSQTCLNSNNVRSFLEPPGFVSRQICERCMAQQPVDSYRLRQTGELLPCAHRSVKADWYRPFPGNPCTPHAASRREVIMAILDRGYPVGAAIDNRRSLSDFVARAPPGPGAARVYSPSCSERPVGGHAVTIVGYRLTPDVPNRIGYWILKNSEGPAWNGDGYFLYDIGTCGSPDVTELTGLYWVDTVERCQSRDRCTLVNTNLMQVVLRTSQLVFRSPRTVLLKNGASRPVPNQHVPAQYERILGSERSDYEVVHEPEEAVVKKVCDGLVEQLLPTACSNNPEVLEVLSAVSASGVDGALFHLVLHVGGANCSGESTWFVAALLTDDDQVVMHSSSQLASRLYLSGNMSPLPKTESSNTGLAVAVLIVSGIALVAALTAASLWYTNRKTALPRSNLYQELAS